MNLLAIETFLASSFLMFVLHFIYFYWYISYTVDPEQQGFELLFHLFVDFFFQ